MLMICQKCFVNHRGSCPATPVPSPVKTGDFVADTRAGYYRWEREEAYRIRQQGPLFEKDAKTTWDEDFRAWLLSGGVPEQYVGKVAYCAYERGHSSGEEEILNCAYDLVEIFRVSR